jgi:hypothetical protein
MDFLLLDVIREDGTNIDQSPRNEDQFLERTKHGP